jgi:hypothetical protein
MVMNSSSSFLLDISCRGERGQVDRLEKNRLLNYFNTHNMEMNGHMLICLVNNTYMQINIKHDFYYKDSFEFKFNLF